MIRRFALFAALALSSASATEAATVGEDIADVTTRACYGLYAGLIGWPAKPDLAAEAVALKRLDLSSGINPAAVEALGRAKLMLRRSTLGERKSGSDTVLFAADDTVCRAIAVGPTETDVIKQQLLAVLEAEKSGWKAIPTLTESRSGVERHVYVRRDAAGRPYILHVMAPEQALDGLRLWTTVERVPPSVLTPNGS